MVARLSSCYRARILTIEPVMFLFVFGKYLFTPLSEQYCFQIYGSDFLRNTSFSFPNGSFCISSDLLENYTNESTTYKKDDFSSNHLIAYGEVASKIPAILTTLILGPLMDRYGRKIGLVLPAIGTSLQGAFFILVIHFNLNPYYFILVNLVSGVFGDSTAILASSFAYVADVSSPRWRSLRIGILESAIAFGKCTAQFFGGFWLHRINCNFIPPMCFYVACNLLIIAYVLTLMPESLTHSERKTLQSKNPKGIRAYIEGFRLFCGRLPPVPTWNLWVALIAANVMVFNSHGAILISVYFLLSPPFDFNSLQIGVYQSVRSMSQGLANLLFTGVLVTLRVTDIWIMLIAFMFHSVCSVLLGFSTQMWQVFTSSLFSIMASSETVVSLAASVSWPIIYPLTLLHNMKSGITYIFMGVLGFMVIPLILSLFLCRREGPVFPLQVNNSGHHEGSRASSSLQTSSDSEEEYKPLLINTKYGISTK